MKVPKELGVLESGAKLILPDEATTQGFAILAKRRSGKSVLAGAMEETFCARGEPWVCLDPASAHWGIKYRDEKGQPGSSSGFDVLVVGGKYGDVELAENMGDALAEIVVETNISCVIDLKMVSMTARKRFVTDFANRLFAINETPRHVFIEEAQEMVPQSPRWPEQKEVLGAMERLIKGGGGQGLGFTLISQRPAAVSKDALTQIDNLFVLRMSGPRDLDAVKEWFEHNVGDREQMREILTSLAAFKPGDAWLLSPDWLGELERLRVRERVTYHAGRTPKKGDKPVRPAALDVGAVVAKFKKAAEQRRIVVQQEKDLRAENRRLQAEIRKLERQDGRPSTPTGLSEAEVARRIRTAVADVEAPLRAHITACGRSLATLQRLGAKALPALQELVEGINRAAGEVASVNGRTPARQADKPVERVATPPVAERPRPVSPVPTSPPTDYLGEESAQQERLSKPQQAILDALALFESVGIDRIRREPLGVQAGASPSSSAYTNNLGALRSAGLIEYPAASMAALTDAGRALARVIDAPPTLADLHERWCRMLSGPQERILRVLVERYPDDIDRAELAEVTGASSISSAYTNNLGRMRTMGVLDYPAPGRVGATALLFPPELN